MQRHGPPRFQNLVRESTARSQLLIVEDDPGMRDCLHLVLDDEYSVLEAADGQTAIKTVQTRSVDLVLLDLLIPDSDGIEILQQVKALRHDLPVIVLTGVKTLRTAVEVMKLGACDYFTKPFQEEELIASIQRALAEGIVPALAQESPHPGSSTRTSLAGRRSRWRSGAWARSRWRRPSSTGSNAR